MANLGEHTPASNLRPLTILASYLSLALLLTGYILRNLLQISKRTRASRATSTQRPQQSTHILLFATLSVVSLAITWYYMLAFFTLSYQTWALEANVTLPTNLWGPTGIFAEGEDAVGVHIGLWLKDTTLFRDAWETVIDGNLRFWWSQQIFLITTAWSIYLAIEGHRRSIPKLWTFMCLGQIIAISFAMNLFFLAILLEPLQSSADGTPCKPLPEFDQRTHSNANLTSSNNRIQEQEGRMLPELYAHDDRAPPATQAHGQPWDYKKMTWASQTVIYTTLILNFLSIFLIPYTAHTRFFMPMLAIPHVLLFVPVVIYNILPRSRTYVQSFPGGSIYIFISVVSLCLYTKATIAVLMEADTRNKLYVNPRRFMAELYTHPAVSSVGWDVILCWSSALLWAISQSIDKSETPEQILGIVSWGGNIKALKTKSNGRTNQSPKEE